jgi:flagellin
MNLLDGTVGASGTASFQVGANGGAALNAAATISVSFAKMDATTLGVDALDVTDLTKSQASIKKIDDAIALVDTSRASYGAKINRLNYAADNLANVSQNTSASRSRIQDTDYAATTTELARTQIISQAATAMLAQANQAPQTVLSLLR